MTNKRIKDLTGERFGKLTAIELYGTAQDNAALWKCVCDCGNTIVVRSRSLLTGSTKSCGCLRRTDLAGKRFGRLVAINPSKKAKDGHTKWECVCDCGNTTFVATNALISGTTRSCGCLFKEMVRDTKTKKTNTLRHEETEDGIVCYTQKGEPFIIDKDDFDVVKNYSWHISQGYVNARERGTGKMVRLHRLIMNPPDGMVVDHINHDTTDNRKKNLRICTQQDNCKNNLCAGYHYRKDCNKWRATLTANGMKHKKTFKTKDEAIQQRMEWEKEFLGEFAPHFNAIG